MPATANVKERIKMGKFINVTVKSLIHTRC